MIAIGSSKCNGLLPSYEVYVTPLTDDDVIRNGDYVCLGSDPQDWHSWCKIADESPFVGHSVTYVRRVYDVMERNVFGRKEEIA